VESAMTGSGSGLASHDKTDIQNPAEARYQDSGRAHPGQGQRLRGRAEPHGSVRATTS
jgi:hypothetical protein